MKNLFFPLIVLILSSSFTSCRPEKQFKFEIDGTINADTGKIKLCFYSAYASNKLTELEAEVKNNKFSFYGFITEPQGVFVLFDDRYKSADFVIEKGLQTVVINVNESDKVPVVSNCIMQNEYPLYSDFFKQHNIKRDICDQKYDSLYRLNNYKLPEVLKSRMLKELNILYKEHDKLLLKYTQKNPNSEIAFWTLVRLMGWGYEPIFDSIYNSFSDDLKKGYAGKVLNTKRIEGKQVSVGKSFPLIPCADISNKPFALDLFKGNTFTLVDFWYSRCNPCRAQFNKLKELYSQFNTKGFEIIAISVDRECDKQNYEAVMKTEKLIWKHYWDINGKETTNLSIIAFPTNFLIDKDGKVVAKNISLEELTQLLNKNLGSSKTIEP